MKTRTIVCPACKDSGQPGSYWNAYEGQYCECTLCRGELVIDIEVDERDKRMYAPFTPEQKRVYRDTTLTPSQAAARLAMLGRRVTRSAVCKWRKKHLKQNGKGGK